MKKMLRAPCLALAGGMLLTLLVAPAAQAGGIVSSKVNGNALEAKIHLPGGGGADLRIEFEQVVGLSAQNLGLDVELLDAAKIAALAGRMPDPTIGVPASFPVLLTIEPPATGGLSFSGVVTIEIYTHDLSYLPGSPLRLYAAPLGGAFHDITASNAAGSYRVRGDKGQFSEFVIVADLRLVDSAIAGKYLDLDSRLTSSAGAIAPLVYGDLVALLDDSSAAYQTGNTVLAISKIEAFGAKVLAESGSRIPDVWRSARDLANAAGSLRAAARTLRFSLLLKANGAS